MTEHDGEETRGIDQDGSHVPQRSRGYATKALPTAICRSRVTTDSLCRCPVKESVRKCRKYGPFSIGALIYVHPLTR
jgi:hypothetical protein